MKAKNFCDCGDGLRHGSAGLIFNPTYNTSSNQLTTLPSGASPRYHTDGRLLQDNLNSTEGREIATQGGLTAGEFASGLGLAEFWT
jgi:hypothetical protein